MTQKVYDPSTKHPPEYQADMNPDAAAGMRRRADKWPRNPGAGYAPG